MNPLIGWDWLPWVTGFCLLVWPMGWWKARLRLLASWTGTMAIGALLLALWLHLERPPLRRLGETRAWHAFFLSAVVAGLLPWYRNALLVGLGQGTALAFLLLNVWHPEWHDHTLRPALQSPWFVPHVATYMIAYAFLMAAAMSAVVSLWNLKMGKQEHGDQCEDLGRTGLALLTAGMVMGAFWAKEAWGHWWAWDPKETWALVTWLSQVFLLHWRARNPEATRTYALLVLGALLLLLVTWFGVQYMPGAAASVHTYIQD